ncbi:hypothetical protein Rs2_42007 [Raphanus sativus]|nr:hypothetical protein Rs2_42007 [Raphanus sativus]
MTETVTRVGVYSFMVETVGSRSCNIVFNPTFIDPYLFKTVFLNLQKGGAGSFPVKFAATDLICCLTLLGHTRKMSEKVHRIRSKSLEWTPERNRMSAHPNNMGLC